MKKRILLLDEISGDNFGLSEGLKELGIKADFINTRPNICTGRPIKSNFFTFVFKLQLKLKNPLLRFFIDIFYSHIIFIYGGRGFLMQNRSPETNINMFNKIFGKKTKKIFIFNGSDARPPVLDGIYVNTLAKNESDPLLYLKIHSEITNNCIVAVESLAHTIIAQPHHNANITKPFINSCILSKGIKEIYSFKPNPLKHHNPEKIIIQHSPSNRIGKGSDIILEVINEIKSEGFNIKYREMHNKTNREVCESLCEAHIFIDQMYSDIPVTFAALEGAFYNCFTIVSGYQLEETLNTIPLELKPNFYYIKPDKSELKSILIKAITDHNFREAQLKKQEKFIQDCSTPKSVAEKFLKAIKGEAPESWYIKDEEPVIYTGAMIEKGQMISNLKNFVSRFGIEATKIKNKKLLNKLQELCAE